MHIRFNSAALASNGSTGLFVYKGGGIARPKWRLPSIRAIARVLRKLLFGIAPADPVTLGGVALILLFTAGLACYFPARRASRVDPMVALRCE